MHWVNQYIGKQWKSGACGPDKYDCFGIVKTILERHYKTILPDIHVDTNSLLSIIKAIKSDSAWSEWELIEKPHDGCLVKLYKQVEPDHIGIWLEIDGGGIIHSPNGGSVCFDKPFHLAAMGWKKLEYYGRK